MELEIKNIIFIDFDEVLTNRTSMFLRSIDKERNQMSYECVSLFRMLLIKTKSTFVVSSSWRKRGEPLQGMNNQHIHTAFESNGFEDWQKYAEPNGVTKHLDSLRGKEIKHWIDNYEAENFKVKVNYVIFDDDSDMLEEQWPHFILVNAYSGLSVTDIMNASRILKSPITWNME
jgi:hypothetical protein